MGRPGHTTSADRAAAMAIDGEWHSVTIGRLIRRAAVAIGIAGFVASVLRLRGAGGTPPQQGGWRELTGPDLR